MVATHSRRSPNFCPGLTRISSPLACCSLSPHLTDLPTPTKSSHPSQFLIAHSRPSKSFSCNTYRKQGWGERVVPVGSPSRPRSLPTTHLRFFLFNFLRTPLHSPKTQLFCFQAIPHSLRKTPGGWGTPQVPGAGCRESFIFSHQSRVTSHAFIQTVTCPEGVHRTYYWNRRTPPPKFLQATVTSFTIAGRV